MESKTMLILESGVHTIHTTTVSLTVESIANKNPAILYLEKTKVLDAIFTREQEWKQTPIWKHNDIQIFHKEMAEELETRYLEQLAIQMKRNV